MLWGVCQDVASWLSVFLFGLRHRLPACGFDTLVSWREVAMGAGTLVCHEGLPRFQILLPTGQEGSGGLQLGFWL